MPLKDEDQRVENFRRKMKEDYGVEMTFAEAKGRYLELLSLFWILAHKPPKEGEPPHEPPLPPWL